jgi:hypothetical protein
MKSKSKIGLCFLQIPFFKNNFQQFKDFFVGRNSCLFKQLLVLGHYFATVLQFGHFSKNVTPVNV